MTPDSRLCRDYHGRRSNAEFGLKLLDEWADAYRSRRRRHVGRPAGSCPSSKRTSIGVPTFENDVATIYRVETVPQKRISQKVGFRTPWGAHQTCTIYCLNPDGP